MNLAQLEKSVNSSSFLKMEDFSEQNDVPEEKEETIVSSEVRNVLVIPLQNGCLNVKIHFR